MTDERDALVPPDPETVEAALTAAYVSHQLTRGHAALYTAARRASMGELESAAGVNDLMQGADMLAASEDITTMSAVVHALNEEDLEEVIEIGAISGELAVLSDVLAAMDMATMADFLLGRSQRLRELAVDNILRYGAVRALSESLRETSATVGALGEEEVAEGEARLDLAEAASANSQALAEAGEEMIAEGLATLAAAQGALDVGEELEL